MSTWPCAFRAVWVLLAVAAPGARGAIIVNPPVTLDRVVKVRLIHAATDQGTSVATGIGSGATRAYIEEQIDRVWAQAGINVAFDPVEPTFWSTFSLRGVNGTGTRSTADLNYMHDGAAAIGLTSPDPQALNVMLVDVSPGYPPKGENETAGITNRNTNRIALFIGDDTLKTVDGRDRAAVTLAHEIGHSLGLTHLDGTLMQSAVNYRGAYLTSAQIATVRASRFVTIPVVAPGDSNGDGQVNAADYVVARATLTGSAFESFFTQWKQNFGSGAAQRLAAAPEPTGALLLLFATPWGAARRLRRGSGCAS